MGSIKSVNPFTEEQIASYIPHSPAEVDAKITKAHKTFEGWKLSDSSKRHDWAQSVAKILAQSKQRFAELMTDEMGKPLKESIAEVEKCILLCDYYAKNAQTFLQDRLVATEAQKSLVSFKPLGVILGIMPWNFPFWQVFRFAIPAVMAGNTTLLKHASNVIGCALALEKIFQEAAQGEPLFQNLIIPSSQMEPLLKDKQIKGIALTGSSDAGTKVAALAGAQLKKVVLELGGSDPYIVLADADLSLAAKVCSDSRTLNGGQSCIAAKRFVVVKSVRAEFETLFLKELQSKKMGNPRDLTTQLGPLARADLRETIHRQLTESLAAGAKLLGGGKMPTGKGFFYPPTLITGVKKGMAAFDQETFGPLAPIIEAENELDALQLANDTPYGLGSALFTEDRDRGEYLAKNFINAGSCFINAMVKSDPRLPFGGIKDSGFGRELSEYGIHEFVNIKTLWIQ